MAWPEESTVVSVETRSEMWCDATHFHTRDIVSVPVGRQAVIGMTTAALAPSACTTTGVRQVSYATDTYAHGVASGDPFATSVVLWTRVSGYDRDLPVSWMIATDPDFEGRVTVPVLWDKQHGRVVNNESSEIIRMFNSAFDGITGNTSCSR